MSDSAKKKGAAAFTDDAKVVVKDVKVMAEDLLRTVKEIIKEGNVRRITVKDREGKVVASFPLAAGVVGTLLAPALAALGALSAVMTECTLSVEKVS
jgi:hypothetical protein